MPKPKMKCPKCKKDRIQKAGFKPRKGGPRQCYQCFDCGYSWVPAGMPVKEKMN